jgi:hypothetical protein
MASVVQADCVSHVGGHPAVQDFLPQAILRAVEVSAG